MNEYWFKPHRYGLGATPCTWEGWALTIAYLVAVIALGSRPLADAAPPATFFILVALLTAVFLVIAWRKTEGGWRWRWGQRD